MKRAALVFLLTLACGGPREASNAGEQASAFGSAAAAGSAGASGVSANNAEAPGGSAGSAGASGGSAGGIGASGSAGSLASSSGGSAGAVAGVAGHSGNAGHPATGGTSNAARTCLGTGSTPERLLPAELFTGACPTEYRDAVKVDDAEEYVLLATRCERDARRKLHNYRAAAQNGLADSAESVEDAIEQVEFDLALYQCIRGLAEQRYIALQSDRMWSHGFAPNLVVAGASGGDDVLGVGGRYVYRESPGLELDISLRVHWHGNGGEASTDPYLVFAPLVGFQGTSAVQFAAGLGAAKGLDDAPNALLTPLRLRYRIGNSCDRKPCIAFFDIGFTVLPWFALGDSGSTSVFFGLDLSAGLAPRSLNKRPDPVAARKARLLR